MCHVGPCWAASWAEIMLQQQTAASETAAVVLEPVETSAVDDLGDGHGMLRPRRATNVEVLGEGGYVPPAPGLLPATEISLKISQDLREHLREKMVSECFR